MASKILQAGNTDLDCNVCQILSKARNVQLHAEILPHLPTDMVQTAIIFAKALVLELNRL